MVFVERVRLTKRDDGLSTWINVRSIVALEDMVDGNGEFARVLFNSPQIMDVYVTETTRQILDRINGKAYYS